MQGTETAQIFLNRYVGGNWQAKPDGSGFQSASIAEPQAVKLAIALVENYITAVTVHLAGPGQRRLELSSEKCAALIKNPAIQRDAAAGYGKRHLAVMNATATPLLARIEAAMGLTATAAR